MDASYNQIYENLVEDYPLSQSRARAIIEGRDPEAGFQSYAIVREATNIAQDEIRLNLRPDAQLFLVTNMHMMVVYPVLQNKNIRLEEGELLDVVTRDVITIGRRLQEMNGEREIIKAADVVRVLPETLPKLRLTSWRLWDQAGE